MAKKESIFWVYKVLEKYSDRQNPMRQQDIIDAVKKDYDATLDRKTIKANIDSLIALNINIEDLGRKKGVYFDNRILEPNEINLLTNMIFTSKSLNGKFATDLYKKLLSVLSINYQKNIKDSMKCIEVNRNNKYSLLGNYDEIYRAIRHKHRIEFNYSTYDQNGNKINVINPDTNKVKNYDVSPYFIVERNGFSYLLCLKFDPFNDKKALHTYRVDLMENVREIEEKRELITSIKEFEKGFNIAKYLNEHIYMFSSKPISIKVKYKNPDSIKYIVGWFGQDATFDYKNKTATIISDPDSFYCWIMQYNRNFILLSPKELVERVKESAKNIIDTYGK